MTKVCLCNVMTVIDIKMLRLMIWCDWHAKQQTSIKYNPNVCMKDMINDMWNDIKNDVICTKR